MPTRRGFGTAWYHRVVLWWTDFLSPAVIVAVVVFLQRATNNRIADTNNRITDTNNRIDALAKTVTELARTVADVDRRLATLEGRIAGWQDRPPLADSPR